MTAEEIAQRRAEAEKYLSVGKADAAEAAYRSILDVEPTNIYALMGLGNVAKNAKDTSAAEQRYRAASAAHPRSSWPLFVLVDLLASLKRWDDGEEAARTAFSISVDDFHTAMALGRLRRARGDHQTALAAFEIASRKDPKNAGARTEVGRTLAALDRHAEAEDCYRQGLEVCPADQHLNLLRALAALARKIGDRPATIRWLQRAVDNAPGDQSLQSELAAETVALAKLANDKSATLDATLAAHQLAPNDVATLIELAAAQRDAGRLDDAAQAYRNALTLKPDNISAGLGLGSIARRRGRHDEALEHYELASKFHPKNSWAQIEVAKSLRDLMRLDEAEVILGKIAATDVHYRHVLMSLADIARARGDRAKAVKLLIEAASHSPDPVPALVNAANEALQIRDFTTARTIADDIAARNPQVMQAPMLDGRIRRAMLDREGARSAFARAAELAPGNAAPLVELATECLALGERAAAETHLEQALALDPDNLQGLLQRAERFRAEGLDDDALALLTRARQAHPAQPWPYLNAAQILAGLGRTDEACRLLNQGRETCGPSASFYACEGGILQEAGFVDRARDVLADGCQRYPRDIWLWGSRATAAISLGDFALAEQMLVDPPGASPAEQARVLLIHAKLDEARWNLEEASQHIASAAELDPTNATAAHEMAKLALFRFDLATTRRWLTRHAQLQGAASAAAGRSPNITQSQLGQIYDEFAIQPKLVGTLAALSAQPAWSRLVGLLETVASNPDATSAALALTIGLRRTGQFDKPHPISPTGAGEPASPIPRVICQYWDATEPPADVRAMIDGWGAAHGGYRHILYDDRSAAAYLKTNAAPTTLQAFLRTRDRTQRADVFRLARLYAEGGIYIDADDRCRGPLEPLLRPGKTFVAFQEDYGSIANNFLAATPQHPVIKRALACAVEATNRGDLNLLWLSTGTGMLTRAFAQVLAAHKDRLNEFLQTVSIVERHAVRVSLVPQCQASYKRAVRHWQTPPFPSSGSVKGAANAAIKTAISQDITPTTSKAVESTPPIT